MADYISRYYAVENMENYPWDTEHDKNAAIHLVRELVPAADVWPVVRGEWLAYPMLDDMCYQHYSCSICKRVEAIPNGYDVKKELPFCHCGAYMGGAGK